MMMKMKIKNNLKGEEMSKGKINPKVQSANDTMIAEMLIEEIDKLSSLYTKVLEREDKIDSQYQKVEKMFANHKLELIEFSEYINRYNDYIKKYEGLSKNAVELANQLFDISKAIQKYAEDNGFSKMDYLWDRFGFPLSIDNNTNYLVIYVISY